MTEKRKLHIKTWGCQMNVYDSGRMADVLAPMGYQLSDEAEQADLVILNTCHIREHATDKLYSELGRMRVAKEARAAVGSKMMIAVAGCTAQAEGAEILHRAPHVDMVFGPQTYHQLPEMVGRAARAGGLVNTDFPADTKFDHLPDERTQGGHSAFLSVQEGCDKFCSFCVVPYTRGAEMSRPVAGVIAEAKRLAQSGIRELVLLGQNVNAYHGEAPDGQVWTFGRLLRELADATGVPRLRYTTSHPRDMADDLITAHRDIPSLMPFLHLPVQSGSNRILAAMNRKHTREDYLRIIDRLREARPDIALAGDFIVGFPGETEQDFADTLDIIEKVGYAQAYSFMYSPRPGTPASGLSSQLTEDEKQHRLHRLHTVLGHQSTHFNQSRVGLTMPVLVEKKGRLEGQMLGKSPWLQSVTFMGPDHLIGQIVNVEILSARLNSLDGIMKSMVELHPVAAA